MLALVLLLLAGVAPPPAPAQAPAPAPASPPPRVAGVGPGSTAREIQRALGTPDRVQESIGMRFWDYEKKGITVIWREGESGARGVVITRADVGPFRGVRVGDDEATVRKEWGEAARVRQDGRFRDFVDAHWVVSVELHDHVVVAMTLIAAADAPPKDLPAVATACATTGRRSRPSR